MIVRLHLADGSTEDHPLKNGLHFADYIRRVDVPDSEYALSARGQQLRHIRVSPRTEQVIREIELVKGNDPTAPIVMAITVEGPETKLPEVRCLASLLLPFPIKSLTSELLSGLVSF